MASFRTVPGFEPGIQMGTGTGSHQEGSSKTPFRTGAWQVDPPAILTTLPSGKVWAPSIRRQIWLSCVMPDGLGKMKRCGSAGAVLVTPESTLGMRLGYSAHDQIWRSMRPPGTQLCSAVNALWSSVSAMVTMGAVRVP